MIQIPKMRMHHAKNSTISYIVHVAFGDVNNDPDHTVRPT